MHLHTCFAHPFMLPELETCRDLPFVLELDPNRSTIRARENVIGRTAASNPADLPGEVSGACGLGDHWIFDGAFYLNTPAFLPISYALKCASEANSLAFRAAYMRSFPPSLVMSLAFRIAASAS